MTNPTHAQDKRTVDPDGRMRVRCHISKANVCPYYGREIPNFEALGLDGDRVYMMYRDPEALRAAASTFDGVPLLDTHIPVTSDAHASENTVGTIHNAEFNYPYLDADVVVWTDGAKELIETELQRELSSAYRYTADMRPGYSPEGVAYDGAMRQIMGNHVALVTEGRAGPDVMVADEKPRTMKFPKFFEALAKLFPAAPPAAALTALDSALAAEIDAMDADLTDEERKAACDAMAAEKGCAADALSDEDRTEALRRAAADKRAKDAAGNASAPAAAVGGAPKPGMDEAAVKAATDAARAEGHAAGKAEGIAEQKAAAVAQDAAVVTTAADAARTEIHALYAARDAVAEKVGLVNIAELKTAAAVYRYALDKQSVPHKDVPDAALAALWVGLSKGQPAQDAATVKPFNVRDILPGLQTVSQG